MKGHLAILLWATDPAQPHLCAAPFFHAAAAAAMDAEVEIHFTGKSIQLLVKGVAESLYPGQSRDDTVYSFMQQAAQHGTRFLACTHAMAEHRVVAADFIPEFSAIAGAAAFIDRCLDDRWSVLTY